MSHFWAHSYLPCTFLQFTDVSLLNWSEFRCAAVSSLLPQSLRLPSQACEVAVRNPLSLAREVGRNCVKSARGAPASPNTQGFFWADITPLLWEVEAHLGSVHSRSRLLTEAGHSEWPSDKCLNTALPSRRQSSGSSSISRWRKAPALRWWCTHRGLHRRPVMTRRVSKSW